MSLGLLCRNRHMRRPDLRLTSIHGRTMASNKYESSKMCTLQVKCEKCNPLHTFQGAFLVGGRSLTNESVVEVVEGNKDHRTAAGTHKSCGTGFPRRRPASVPHLAFFHIPYILLENLFPSISAFAPRKTWYGYSRRRKVCAIALSNEQAVIWAKETF